MYAAAFHASSELMVMSSGFSALSHPVKIKVIECHLEVPVSSVVSFVIFKSKI